MSVSNTSPTRSYAGNGFTTNFVGPQAQQASHIKVYLVTALGVETLQSAYVLTGLNTIQTNIVMTTAPAAGLTLRIDRVVPYTQLTRFTNQGPFLPELHEKALDLAAMRDQQLDERLTAAESQIFNSAGDLTLRADLAAANLGSDLVTFRDTLATVYLKTTSDIINGLPVSLHRFLPPAELAAIRAHTSTYDCSIGINVALQEILLRSLYIPNGRHNYAGNLPRSGSLSIRGESNRHSILRCIGAGGFVFTGGAVGAFTSDTLDLENIRMLAAIADAGTAVTMSYTGGSGSPSLGPRWMNVAIEAEVANTGYNKGVRGTNVRDFRIVDLTTASSTRVPGWPANFIMTHGMELDGDNDPVELWISNYYSYYNNQAIKVSGQYEGLYVDHMHTVAVKNGIDWDSATPNPVAMISDSYLTAELDCVNLNRVSYFKIQNNTINPTAPTPYGNFRGVIVRRTVGDQTQASSINGNTFIGVGYSSVSAFTETGVYLENANTVEVVDNTIYDMDVGVKGIAGLGNRIHNRYISVTTQEDMPASMRTGDTSPELVFKAAMTVATQAVPKNVLTTILFDTEERDDRNVYTPGTGLFMPPAGHYNVRGRLRITDGAVGDFLSANITIGGVAVHSNGIQITVAGTNAIEVTGLIEVTGAQNVAIRMLVETAAAGANRTVLNSAPWSRFEAVSVTQ